MAIPPKPHQRPARRWPSLLVAVAVASLAVAGCASETTPTTTRTTADLTAAGETLYQAHCAVCHGDDLYGTDMGPSMLSIVYEPNHHGDGAFQVAVIRGAPQHHWSFGDMPPVPGLSTDDVAAIVAFVRGQQEVQGFQPYPP